MLPTENDPVQRYLENLQRELKLHRVEALEDALNDAREFLENERQHFADDSTAWTSEQWYAYFVEIFGSPRDVALSYLETPAIVTGALRTSNSVGSRRWRHVAAMVIAVLGGLGGLCMAGFLQEPPEVSPFTEVRHDKDKTIVRFREKDYELVALDDIPTDKILRAAKDHFGVRWQKRFAEDLVQVLWAMNHRPGSTVKLELRDPATGKIEKIVDAEMTEANRTAVWYARNEASRESQPVSAEQLTALVNEFKTILRERWSYYPLSAPKIDAAIDGTAGATTKGTNTAALALELQKVIAHGIDGHAAVSGWKLERGYLPFLIEPSGDRYVAFRSDRSGFVADGYPYITSIDGRPIQEWIEKVKSIVPKGSPAYVQRNAVSQLRNIQHWRRELGLPVTNSLDIELQSQDGKNSAVEQLPVVDRLPAVAAWPRSESRLLEGNIGYLRIASMDDGAIDEIKARMTEFRDTHGLIVDVRGNGGGSRDALRWLASFLMSESDLPRVVNCAKYRSHTSFSDDHLESRFMYRANSTDWSEAERAAITEFRKSFKPEWEPPAELFSDWHYMVLDRFDYSSVYHYTKPVVVLMNAKCFSATDIFLASLKGWPNVTLVGMASSGGSARAETYDIGETSIKVRLGSMVSFMPNGELFDTNGVQPDVMVQPEPSYFIGQSDDTLDKAIKIIRNGQH